MELTKKERLVFNYQLKILKKLYPREATFFVQKRNTLNNGFVAKCRNMADFLFGELSEEDCLEVLDMWTAITSSLLKLEKSDNLHNHPFAKFNGFDGNNEGNRMAYLHYHI